MDFTVDVEQYAGPLDLLLFLVRREELDLSIISLSRLANQFSDYLEVLSEFNVDDVGEFLEIASILIEMKAKSVLPHDDRSSTEEESEIIDPSDQLVPRLIQYKRYRDAATMLDEQSRRWQLRYPRLADDMPSRSSNRQEQPIADLEIWDLVSAFGRVLRENRKVHESVVAYDETPIHVYMQQIHERIRKEQRIELQSLFVTRSHKSALVALFLATLELTRHHGVIAHQVGDTSAIWLAAGADFNDVLHVAEVDVLVQNRIEKSNMPLRPK